MIFRFLRRVRTYFSYGDKTSLIAIARVDRMVCCSVTAESVFVDAWSAPEISYVLHHEQTATIPVERSANL